MNTWLVLFSDQITIIMMMMMMMMMNYAVIDVDVAKYAYICTRTCVSFETLCL